MRVSDSLVSLPTSVHVVSKKEIIRLRWEPSVLEQSQQVCVLPVNITLKVAVRS